MFVILGFIASCLLLAGAQHCGLSDTQQQDFSPQQFAGNWYPSLLPPTVATFFDNFTVNFVWVPQGGNKVNVSCTLKSLKTSIVEQGEWGTQEGDAYFTVSFENFFKNIFSSTYLVVCTDYTTYSIVQSCSGLFPNAVYILYRDEHPTPATVRDSRENLKKCVGDVPLVADSRLILTVK